MPARALSMPPWVRTIAPNIPAGGGTTDTTQADTATPQASDRESETPSDNNSGDDEGDPDPDPEPEPGPADDATVWKKHARTWETRAKENKKTADSLQAQLDAETGKTKKAEEALAEATKRQQEAETAAARLELALEYGLSRKEAETFLHGDTEAMRTQAQLLADRAGAGASKSRPATSPLQGKGKAGSSKENDRHWARRLMGKTKTDK
nr:MAG TPA: hypothetical protein [Caudoviricetes sp.]